jgi:hypothetical protein
MDTPGQAMDAEKRYSTTAPSVVRFLGLPSTCLAQMSMKYLLLLSFSFI